jgi:hypothetical protein
MALGDGVHAHQSPGPLGIIYEDAEGPSSTRNRPGASGLRPRSGASLNIPDHQHGLGYTNHPDDEHRHEHEHGYEYEYRHDYDHEHENEMENRHEHEYEHERENTHEVHDTQILRKTLLGQTITSAKTMERDGVEGLYFVFPDLVR